jgi:hypothetical protein
MIWLAFFLPGALLALLLFWIMWAAISAMSRARDEGRLSTAIIRIGEAFAAFGLVYDCLCNIAICTFLFAEFPREPTLSQRLRRLVMGSGWRSRLAIWVAMNLVNPFSIDPKDPHIPLPQ